jgi:hypothetical protein
MTFFQLETLNFFSLTYLLLIAMDAKHFSASLFVMQQLVEFTLYPNLRPFVVA